MWPLYPLPVPFCPCGGGGTLASGGPSVCGCCCCCCRTGHSRARCANEPQPWQALGPPASREGQSRARWASEPQLWQALVPPEEKPSWKKSPLPAATLAAAIELFAATAELPDAAVGAFGTTRARQRFQKASAATTADSIASSSAASSVESPSPTEAIARSSRWSLT